MNTSLQTLVDIQQQQIEDLKKQLADVSAPDIDALINIMNEPDVNLKRSADDHEFNNSDQEDQTDFTCDVSPFNNSSENKKARSLVTEPEIPRTYAKKQVVIVTDPAVLFALNFMARSVYTYTRKRMEGYSPDGFDTPVPIRYAFYYGKINKSGAVGLLTTVVLSSDLKVYNISDVEKPIEMHWNQDKQMKGKKRGYGHIYLGKLAAYKGFETYLQDVFMTELGVAI